MDLILWRHAEAHDAQAGEDDLQRRLTPRGEKQAQRMARWLDKQLPESASLYCSPAERTRQTAQALGRRWRVSSELLPGAAPAQLLALAQWPTGRGPVVLLGHQPVLGETIALLMGIQAGVCSVKKGAVWWLRHRERDGEGQITLYTVQPPDLL